MAENKTNHTNNKVATVSYVETILRKLYDWMPFTRKNNGILQNSKDENGILQLHTTNAGEIALGKYNESDINTLLSIGIGSRDVRKNALKLTHDGELFIITDIETGKVESLQESLKQKEVTFCDSSDEFGTYLNTNSIGKLLYLKDSDDVYSAGLYIVGIKSNGGQITVFSCGSDLNVDLSNYYTKEEVNIIIDKINSGDIDLTNYYTINEIDEKFNVINSSIDNLTSRVDNIDGWIETPITTNDLETIIGEDLDGNGNIGF